MNHEQRIAFQEAIINLDKPLDVESKYCVPRLADKTQKQEHFYNDTFKFSVCLPTKTGCTNWQRGLGKVSHGLTRPNTKLSFTRKNGRKITRRTN